MAADKDCLYGLHTVRHALVRVSAEDQLFIQKGVAGRRAAIRELRAEAERRGITVQERGRSELTRLAGVVCHQGVVLRRQARRACSDLNTVLRSLPSTAMLLILDSVQDPRNFGACLRTAAAAGVQAVIAPSRRTAPLSGVAYKAASGAAERVPVVRVTNVSEAMRYLKKEDFWLIGLDSAADRDIYDPDIGLTGRLAFIAGAEGAGLRRLTRENCDFLVRIPMEHDGAESLNLSVAVGIALFEARRRTRS